MSVSDLGDDGEQGEGADRLFIYDLDGEELENRNWEYEGPYLFDKKTFYLTKNNSVFVHYTDLLPLPDGSSYIRHYSFENNMTSIASINNWFIEFIICLITLRILLRQNYRKQSRGN